MNVVQRQPQQQQHQSEFRERAELVPDPSPKLDRVIVEEEREEEKDAGPFIRDDLNYAGNFLDGENHPDYKQQILEDAKR